ncbi:MAG: stage V sporulation protein AA [Lachnospiraceae bacterium]|nr:stage V sporulation protein AA [Lachnospiraceae bacterium]
MSDILYIKIDRNIVVKKPQVALSDIASMTCTNKPVVNRLKTLRVHTFHQDQRGKSRKPKGSQEVFSILKIMELIGQEYPELEIQNEGETDFVVEYIPAQEVKWLELMKVVLVCILIFFGSAFTIMTFNNDVGVADVFAKFYRQVMGRESTGFTQLEVCYAIGIAAGILVFFNHIGHKKITHDPTPMQVEMRKYEQDVDTTFIENSSRKGTNIDVD